MKHKLIRMFALTLAVLMLATLVGTCASCDFKPGFERMEEVERADRIVEFFEEEPSHTYAVDIHMVMQGIFYGIRTESDARGTLYNIGLNSDTPTVHEEVTTTTKIIDGRVTVTHESVTKEGFRDGKMYLYREENDVKTALVSTEPVTMDEYNDYLSASAVDSLDLVGEAVTNAALKTSAQNEAGNWVATFSGYSKETLEPMIGDLFGDISFMLEDHEVTDLILTLEITQDFAPVCIGFDPVFSPVKSDTEDGTDKADADDGDDGDGEDAIDPVMSVSMTIKDIGTAEAPAVDFADYRQVKDLRPYGLARRSMRDYTVADSISFTADSNVTVAYQGQQDKQSVTDEVTARLRDGRYSFEVDETHRSGQESAEIRMTYKDGKCKIRGDGIETQTEAMTDAQAHSTIMGIMDPAGLHSSALVSSIREGSGEYDYIFTLSNPDYSEYVSSFDAMGATDYKANATVAVKLEDGVVTAYQYDFKLKATVEGSTLAVTVVTVVTLTDAGDSSVTV